MEARAQKYIIATSLETVTIPALLASLGFPLPSTFSLNLTNTIPPEPHIQRTLQMPRVKGCLGPHGGLQDRTCSDMALSHCLSNLFEQVSQ